MMHLITECFIVFYIGLKIGDWIYCNILTRGKSTGKWQ